VREKEITIMTERLVLVAIAGGTLMATALAESRFPVEHHETVRRSVRVPSASTAALEVSNVNGAITVTGVGGDTVELVADRKFRARTDADLDTARRVLGLDLTNGPGGVLVCGDASARCRCDEQTERRGRWDDLPYRVETRLELRVPRGMAIRACTVNGRISSTDLGAAARLTTVNGPVEASFQGRPATSSSFRTVNGDVVVSFPASLSADLRLKTLNGGLFTDFDTTVLPSAPVAGEQRNGKFVYRSDRSARVRVGRGGPEFEFETVNGDVRVLKR
jgi:hypothetical protein